MGEVVKELQSAQSRLGIADQTLGLLDVRGPGSPSDDDADGGDESGARGGGRQSSESGGGGGGGRCHQETHRKWQNKLSIWIASSPCRKQRRSWDDR